MSWQSDPKPSGVDTDNIIRLAFDKLSAEHRKGFEELRKKIQEEMDQERKNCEDEAMSYYMSHFSMAGKALSSSSRMWYSPSPIEAQAKV